MADTIHCELHGDRTAAYVCAHILETLEDEEPRGFLDLVDEDGDHQAICIACNTMPFEDWERTAAENMRAICWGCFERAAAINGVDVTAPGPRGS